MTVYIEKPAFNLREELASLRNQGGYQEQQFYFDGLVTNGTFDADLTGWTLDAGYSNTVVSSQLVCDRNGDTDGNGLYQSFSTVVGKTYTATVDIVSLADGGRARIMIGTSAYSLDLGGAASITPAGTYSYTFVALATTTYISLGVDFDSAGIVTYDNVSVFEVDANDDVIHTMPKGWKPKDVFEDGLLQREGAANDYEVVYDGFDYVVKPTVAPSATTQTCVIGVKA